MRIGRIAAVTAALMVAGAVFGTVAGALVLGSYVAVTEQGRLNLADLYFVLQFALVIGGGLGAVLGPLAAWVLMRHVPLWMAVGGTTLGTLASGGLSLLLAGDPVSALLWGFFGFVASAFALRNHVHAASPA